MGMEAATNPGEPRSAARILGRSALLILPVLMIAVTLLNYLQGSGISWASGGIIFSDLTQHYVAGQMWREGERREIYRDFILGDRLNTWMAEVDPEGKPGNIERFNYVYAPGVAWVAAALAVWPYQIWVAGWLVVLGLSWVGALALLMRALPEAFRADFSTLALYFGFPSFYLALVPGQNTPLTLAVAGGALLLQARGAPLAAGLVMSCAFYKPQLMPGLFLFMAVLGQFRFCAGLVLGNTAWMALGIILGGFESHGWWLQSLQDMSRGLQFVKPGMNQSWAAWLPQAQPLGAVLGLVFPLAAGWWARRLKLPAAPALACGLAAGLAGSPYLGYYELLLGVPWWWWHWRQHGGRLRAALFGLGAWLAAAGLFLKIPLAAPLLLAWLVWTLAPPSPQARTAP